jgi:hypothetical protein
MSSRLAAIRSRPAVVADDREGDGDDGDVEQQHRRAGRHDGEREPSIGGHR